MHQLLATLCVASSLTLFAWGGANPTSGFCLRSLSCCRPMAIVGPILDMITVSHGVAGASCEELGCHVDMCLLRPFNASVRAHRFASSVDTPWDYNTGNRPCLNLRPLARPPIPSSPPSLRLKGKRDGETYLETWERVVDLIGHCISFPSNLLRCRAGSRQRSPKSTCKTS
jgi:hypothetical protein